ncbi:MAG: acetylglutamate kinase [Saprospiraceae bacterium]
MKELFILKIGGKVIEDQVLLNEALELFAQQAGYKILIHGGGKRATEVSKQLNIPVQMVNGRRITDAATLEVAVMVYAGLANKTIVAKLQTLDCNAIGLSGADANAIIAHKRPVKDVDYGFAGDVDAVNVATIQTLLEGSLTPVFCAITHDKKGQLLNTNADTIAMQLATAMAPHYNVSLNFCFEKPGVLLNPDNNDSVITNLNQKDYQNYIINGIITDGMLPKLDNAFAALQKGVKEVRIGDVEGIFTHKGTLLRA